MFSDKVREKARKKRVQKARAEGELERKKAEIEAKKQVRLKNQVNMHMCRSLFAYV